MMAYKQADGSDHALCSDCAEDTYLKQYIQDNGTPIRCSECGEEDFPAIPVEELAEFIEPLLREYFEPGPDPYGTGQQGNELSYCVYEVVGQELRFEEQLVDAVVESDDYMPSRGEVAYWDDTFNYVKKEVHIGALHEQWLHALEELKHGRRFYSPAAKGLFDWLFEGMQGLRTFADNEPVVHELPQGTEIFRARVAHSDDEIGAFLEAPFHKVGPPPKELSRAGRMNAEGVTVLYSALDFETCLAEMRPSISNELGVIALRTTEPLRVLDFSRLEKARGDTGHSYFQPDYDRALQKSHFLRMLHYLISQPIVPGHEADYLITQTMAEYLAHVYAEPFDGILFRSSQNEGGMNLVLFSDPELLIGTKEQKFRVQYQANSIKFHKVTAVAYTHHDMEVLIKHEGGIYKRPSAEGYDEDD
jgi:hypothetical protein